MPLIIDVGSKYIHFIQENNKEGLKYHSVLVPEGAITDGEIIHIDAITELIKETIKKEQYEKKQMTFLIYSSSMLFKEVILPKVKPKEMQVLMEQEMQGVLLVDEAYVLDYKIIENIDAHQNKVLIMAMPKSIIASYIQVAKGVGTRRCRIDTQANSIAKLMSKQQLEESETIILADIGNSMLHLHLFEGKSHVFSRSVTINTEQYKNTLILMGQLRDDEAFYELDLSSEALEQSPVVFNILTPYLNSILVEMQNMIQFQLGRMSHSPVNAIYIHGGMANMKGIAAYLEAGLTAEIRCVEQLNKMFEKKAFNNYLTGLGDIYKSSGKEMNLYEAYKCIEKQNNKVSSIARVGSLSLVGQGMILIGVIGSYFVIGSQNNQKAEELIAPYRQETVRMRLEQLHEMNKQVQTVKEKSSYLKNIGEKIVAFPKLDHLFWREISRQIPTDMRVNKISYQLNYLRMECETPSEQEILDFIYALRKVEGVEEVGYTGYAINDGRYYFTIDLTLKGGAV